VATRHWRHREDLAFWKKEVLSGLLLLGPLLVWDAGS
jgi:hypothetical protein